MRKCFLHCHPIFVTLCQGSTLCCQGMFLHNASTYLCPWICMPQLLLCKSCSPLDFTSLWPLSSEWLLHNKTISKRLVWFLPPSFFAAGHYYNRTKIVALSAILWAPCTFLFARTTTIHGAMLIWACNGLNMTYALRWIYACIEELCMLKVQSMSLCTIAS